MLDTITNVTIIGAGNMGSGICQVFARHGFNVRLMDIRQETIGDAIATIIKDMDLEVATGAMTEAEKKEALRCITTFTDLAPAVMNAQLVIEAATEHIDVKLDIFRQLDLLSPANCILATNTSAISVALIASATQRPEKVVGMHFMDPATEMKLVDVINGYATAPETTYTIFTLAERIGKVPCVANDYPGFVANRILLPMINEAIIALQEGVAGVKEIDTIMKLGMAHPMGPLHLADNIGLDTCLSVLNVLYKGTGNRKYAASTLLVNMVQAGYLGAKTGEGFYKYSPETNDYTVSNMFAGKERK